MKAIINLLVILALVGAIGCDGEFWDEDGGGQFALDGSYDDAHADDSGDSAFSEGDGDSDGCINDTELLEAYRQQTDELIAEMESMREAYRDLEAENDYLSDQREEHLDIIDDLQVVWCKEFGICEFQCP